MSKLTYKVKHGMNLLDQLLKAKQVAQIAIDTKTLSSKNVAHIGLPSVISNQILRKYSKNKKCKKLNSVKLTVPRQGIKYKDNQVYISCLRLAIPFTIPPSKQLVQIKQVELDNIYVYICCEVEDHPYNNEECGYLGIDRNATGHIAVIAFGSRIIKLGKMASHINKKYRYLRAKAQKRGSFKFIKKLKNRESRITKDINHKISKKIVELAKSNNFGIKLEKLQGIRKKSQGKEFNRTKSNWSFYQLEGFIEYKAKLSGVRVYHVNPAYTSKNCSRCGLIGSRESKVFRCNNCGHHDHADANASFNIAKAVPLIVQT